MFSCYHSKGVREIKRQITIIGANDIGIQLAETLGAESQNVVLIDERAEFLHELTEEVDVLSLSGNPLAQKTLKTAGVGAGTVLIAVTDFDEVNLLMLFLGQTFGIKEGYALVKDRECYKSFLPLTARLGGRLHLIDLWELVINEVEKKSGFRMRMLYCNQERETVLTALEYLSGHPLIGESINQLKWSGNSKVLQVVEKGKFRPVEPGMKILAGQPLLLSIDEREWAKLAYQLCPAENMRKIMLGGEGILKVMKEHWPHFLRGLVCVEKNFDKCQKILKIDKETLLLKGDGLDIPLLKDAGIEKAGMFIAASENDEVNLLASLLARSFGVKDILTVLHRRQHTGMLERLTLERIIAIPQLVNEYFQSILFDRQPIPSLAQLKVRIQKEKLPTGLNLVFRAGAFVPVTEETMRGLEEVIVIS